MDFIADTRIPLRFSLALAGLLQGFGDPRPATAPAAPAISADSVFARYYRAIGGLDRLLAVSSRRMWGTYREGPLVATTDIAWRRPDTRRVNVHAPGNEIAEGFDGHTWEYEVERHHLVVDTAGAAADAGRRGAEFDESFVDYARKGHNVVVLGAERFAGRPVTRVRVTLADGWVKEYLFDQGTGLIAALRKAMPIHARGKAVQSLSSYADWRVVDGLLVPHRFVERETATGRLMNTLQWDSIRTNVTLDQAELGRPLTP